MTMTTTNEPLNPARFTPLSLQSAYNRRIGALGPDDCSARVLANRSHLLTGKHELWGIPFVLGSPDASLDRSAPGNVALIKDEPVYIAFSEPRRDPQLVFLNAADFKETPAEADGIVRNMRGTPRLGEIVCEYRLHYADGTMHACPMRRRYEISEFQVNWGENSFAAVKHGKPRTKLANSDLPYGEAPDIPWGQSQLRTTFQGFGNTMHHWLYALDNPHPDKELTGVSAHPVDGVALLFGMTGSSVSSNPLRWQGRRKVKLHAPPTFVPQPYGDAANIRIDLGEVIAAAPALAYDEQAWLDGVNPPLPVPKSGEWIVEYTAHPDAQLIVEGTGGEPAAIYDMRNLESYEAFTAMADNRRKVTVRVTDRATGKLIPAKLHIHGVFGEYIAPVNGHRLPNPHWFEDYGAEHVQGYHYSCYIDGEAQYWLPEGTIYIEATKGFEMQPVRRRIEIGETTERIDIRLEHVLPWRQGGWVTADTHVHFLSPQTALLEGAAEGVNVIHLLTSQWGEMFSNIGDFDGKTTIGSKEAGGSGEYMVRVGTENRQHVLGHISLIGYEGAMILPLCTGGPDESPLGDPLSATVTEWARQCRAQNGLSVLPHLPNPRAEGAAAIVLEEIDAIELCSFENKGINPYSLSDWYRYLNCGYHMPAVGGTDKMSQSTAVGTIRTYALIKDKPFTFDNWMEAVRIGHTFATFGPLLEFSVGGREMGERITLSSSGGTLDVVWQVASCVIPVTRIELVVNGELREEISVEPSDGRYSGHWSLPVSASCWVALRVRGRYPDSSEVIAAHSSAVMIAVDGKPCFHATDAVTILEQIEGSTAYIRSLATEADERSVKRMLMTLQSAHRALHNRMHEHDVLHRHSAHNHHEHKHHP